VENVIEACSLLSGMDLGFTLLQNHVWVLAVWAALSAQEKHLTKSTVLAGSEK
jgi:hypothetical protein